MGYPCVKVQQLRLWQTAFSFRGKVGYPILHIFIYLFTIFIHISHILSHKINILYGVKLLSGILPFIANFRILSTQKCYQNFTFLFTGKVGYSTFCSAHYNQYIASPICQEEQSERTFPILPFPLSSIFFPLFSDFLKISRCQGVTLPRAPPPVAMPLISTILSSILNGIS